MNKDNLLLIGKIVNSFGLKGELKITSESDFKEYRFRKGAIIYLKLGSNYKEFKISSYRLLKGNVIITINELYDINDIESFIGCDIYANKSDTPPLKENEYLVDDLIGLDVYFIDDLYYGKVEDVIINPHQQVLVIKVNENIEYLPFVKDFIKKVESDKIIIRHYEKE